MLTVVRGSAPLDWRQEIHQRRRFSFSDFAMARKAAIGGVLVGGWYGYHERGRSGFLGENNVERRICCCADLRSGSGLEYIAP